MTRKPKLDYAIDRYAATRRRDRLELAAGWSLALGSALLMGWAWCAGALS